MLYNNLPDYTRRREGLPSSLPISFSGRRKSLRQAGRARRTAESYQMRAMRPHPASRTVTPDRHRPDARAQQRIRPAAITSLIPSFKLPGYKLPSFALRPRAMIALAVAALFGLSLVTGLFPPAALTQAFSGLTSSQEDKAAAAQKARIDAYTATVNKLIAANPGEDIAVTTIDLSDNSTLTLGDQGTFTAASTAKLLTAVTLLREVEAGRLSLNKYISGVRAGDLLERMIVQSDNNAWQALNGYLTHSVLEAYATNLGWSRYDAEVNSLRPADMASLAAKLYKGELLNPANTKLLLDYMLDSTKQEYIVTNVPVNGYTTYHKAGWLDGLMHDVAIIKGKDKTIVLAIYTFSGDSSVSGDTFENQELFAGITKAALQAYFPQTKATGQAE